jgi:hypothetical protein
MIEQLIKEYGSSLVFPLATAMVLPYMAKGIFGLQRSRSQDRKDFLDLWTKREKADDLWLQVAVRHAFGEYLPAAMLRQVLSQPQGGRALVEISEVWPLIDLDNASGQLYWRKSSHFLEIRRKREQRISLALYFLLAALSIMGAWLVLSGYAASGWVEWTYILACLMAAGHCLVRQDRLKTAETAVPRWLGSLAWKGGGYNHSEVSKPAKFSKQSRRKGKGG